MTTGFICYRYRGVLDMIVIRAANSIILKKTSLM